MLARSVAIATAVASTVTGRAATLPLSDEQHSAQLGRPRAAIRPHPARLLAGVAEDAAIDEVRQRHPQQLLAYPVSSVEECYQAGQPIMLAPVPTLTPQAKYALSAERLSLDKTQNGWLYISALCAASIAVTPAFLGGIVVAGGMALRFYNRRAEYDHALNDPPRRDYETATRARRRRFDPQPLGRSALARAAGDLGVRMTYGDAYLSAVVRADERWLGARSAGDFYTAELHWREAREYATDFAHAQAITREAIEEVAAQIETDPTMAMVRQPDAVGDRLQDRDPEVTVWHLLPKDAQRRLRRVSVIERALSLPLRDVRAGASALGAHDEPVAFMRANLAQLAEDMSATAEEILREATERRAEQPPPST